MSEGSEVVLTDPSGAQVAVAEFGVGEFTSSDGLCIPNKFRMSRRLDGIDFRGSIDESTSVPKQPRFRVAVHAPANIVPLATFGPVDDDGAAATPDWVWQRAVRVFAPSHLDAVTTAGGLSMFGVTSRGVQQVLASQSRARSRAPSFSSESDPAPRTGLLPAATPERAITNAPPKDMTPLREELAVHYDRMAALQRSIVRNGVPPESSQLGTSAAPSPAGSVSSFTIPKPGGVVPASPATSLASLPGIGLRPSDLELSAPRPPRASNSPLPAPPASPPSIPRSAAFSGPRRSPGSAAAPADLRADKARWEAQESAWRARIQALEGDNAALAAKHRRAQAEWEAAGRKMAEELAAVGRATEREQAELLDKLSAAEGQRDALATQLQELDVGDADVEALQDELRQARAGAAAQAAAVRDLQARVEVAEEATQAAARAREAAQAEAGAAREAAAAADLALKQAQGEAARAQQEARLAAAELADLRAATPKKAAPVGSPVSVASPQRVLAELRRQVEELTAAAEAAQLAHAARVADLEGNVRDARQAAADAEADRDTLRHSEARRAKQYSAQIADLDAAASADKAALEDTRQQTAALRAALESAQTQLETSLQASEELKASLKRVENERATVVTNLEHAGTHVTQLQGDVCALTASLDKAHGELDTLRATIETQEAALAGLQGEAAAKQAEVDRLRSARDAAAQKAEESGPWRQALMEQLQATATKLEAQQDALLTHTMRFRSLQDDHAAVTTERDALQQAADAARADLSAKQAELVGLQARLEGALAEVEHRDQQLAALRQATASSPQRNQPEAAAVPPSPKRAAATPALPENEEDVTAELTRREAELAATRKQVTSLAEHLRVARWHVAHMRAGLVPTAESPISPVSPSPAVAMSTFLDALKATGGDVTVDPDLLARFRAVVHGLSQQMADLRQAEAAATQRVTTLTAALEARDAHIMALEVAVKSSSSPKKPLRASNGRSRHTVQSALEAASKVTAALAAERVENAKLQHELDVLRGTARRQA